MFIKNTAIFIFIYFVCTNKYLRSLESVCTDINTFNILHKKQLYDKTLQDIISGRTQQQKKIYITFNYSIKVLQIFELSNQFIKHYIGIIDLIKKLNGYNHIFTYPQQCIYDIKERQIYFINENYSLDLDSNGQYTKQKNIFQRLQDYINIAENIKILHDQGYIFNDVRPQRIRDLLPVNKKGDFDCVGFIPTNSPEKNDPSLLTSSQQSQDIFSFGMSLAYIELGFQKLTKLMGLNVLKKNYIQENYQNQKTVITQLLQVKFIQHQKKQNIFQKFIRFFKSLFYKMNPLEDCEDFICVIQNYLIQIKLQEHCIEFRTLALGIKQQNKKKLFGFKKNFKVLRIQP